MNNALYDKAMEKLSDRTGVKVVNNKNDYLKWTLKKRYI